MSTDPIIQALTECRDRGLTVWLDNDSVDAYDEVADEKVLHWVGPERMLESLLTHFGVKHEHV